MVWRFVSIGADGHGLIDLTVMQATALGNPPSLDSAEIVMADVYDVPTVMVKNEVAVR